MLSGVSSAEGHAYEYVSMALDAAELVQRLEASLRQFHSPQQCRRLAHGFFKLTGRNRIGHNAGAGLDVVDSVLPHDGSQGDAGVHVAGKIDVADSAAIGAAAGGLQLVDNLHGADFLSAADGADREGDA